jgi:hypothetical protein
MQRTGNVPFWHKERRRRMTTALVPVAPERHTSRPLASYQRGNADFIAHLIATAAQAPQTRARRRAEPEQAIAAYSALGQWPSEAGGALSRSL